MSYDKNIRKKAMMRNTSVLFFKDEDLLSLVDSLTPEDKNECLRLKTKYGDQAQIDYIKQTAINNISD